MTQSPYAGETPPDAARFRLRAVHFVIAYAAATLVVVVLAVLACVRFYFELFPATDVHLRNDSGEVLRDVRFIAEESAFPGRATRRGWRFATFDALPPGASVEAPYDRRGHFLRVEFACGGVRHVWREVCYIDSDEWGAIDLAVGPGPRLITCGANSVQLPEEAR